MAYATTTYLAVATIAAAAMSAYSSIQMGQSQKKIAEFNSAQSAQAATSAREAAASNAYKQMLVDEAEMASNRVYFATSGVRIDEGTPVTALGTDAGRRALTVAAIRLRGQQEASNLLAQGAISQEQGKSAATAGSLQGASTLLSGAGRAYGTYTLGKKP
jgi:hypothetical protein